MIYCYLVKLGIIHLFFRELFNLKRLRQYKYQQKLQNITIKTTMK